MNNMNKIIICILIIILLLLFLEINKKENFDLPLEENGFNLVDCDKFPYLCSKGNKNINYSQYPYRKPVPLKNLNIVSPRYKRGTSYRMTKTQQEIKNDISDAFKNRPRVIFRRRGFRRY